jgi:DNA-binding protein HU-beta/integration host factor subunit alpha
MNNKEYISALARSTRRRNAETEQMIATVTKAITEHLQNGDSVQLSNLGVFEVKKKMERIIVNPGTGQRMLVPPKLVLNFKPNTAWRTQIKNDSTTE